MDLPLTNPFERINLARDAALRLDPKGVARGLFTPAEASPEERKTWVSRFLGTDEGPLAGVLHLVSNPLVLAGLVLTARYPVATAGRMLQFAQDTSAYLRKLPPFATFFQDFHELFRGTPLPEMFDYVVRTHHEANNRWAKQFGQAVEEFEQNGGKYTKDVGRRVAAWLDGLDKPDHPTWTALRDWAEKNIPGGEAALPGAGIKPLQLTPQEQALGAKFRAIQRDIFAEVRGDGIHDKALLKAFKQDGLMVRSIKELEQDYFPHIESLSREELQKRHQQWWASVSADTSSADDNMRLIKRMQASKRLMEREGLMLPDPKDLQALGADDRTLKLIDAFDDRLTVDTELGPINAGVTRKYSLNLLKTTENYTRSMARTLAWAVPASPKLETSVGDAILAEFPKVAKASPVKAALLRDTYIPLARGQITQEQMVDSVAFAEMRDWAATKLRALPLPDDLRKKLEAPLARFQDVTKHSLGNAITDWFYTSALGGNITSAARNLTQTLLTTYPMIGGKYTARGMAEVMERVPTYTRLLKQGVAEEEAFSRAFAEFAATDFAPGQDYAQTTMARLIGEEANGIRLPSAIRAAKEKAQKVLLTPFTMTERFNRLVAFYGGRAKALDELPGTTWSSDVLQLKNVPLRKGSPQLDYAANQFGTTVARMTQFGGGPLNSPAGIVKWWAPYRQFLSFPLRVTGFLTGPGTTLGGEGAANYGTIGRALLGAGVAYEAGKMAGMDLSDNLLFGALPAPRDQGPGAPVPLPPFLSVGAAVVSSAVKGDLEDIKKSWPLMVPGGIGLGRAVTVLPGGVAAHLGKPYADYDRRLPDGRIPVFTPSGQLQGYYTQTQLFAKAVGLGDVAGQKEAVLNKYLLAQRERWREFRTRYLEAMLGNDVDGMALVNAEFQQAYPGLGNIQVKDSDVKRVQAAQDMPRLDRILATMPEQSRGMFAQVVATSMAADSGGFLGGNYSSVGVPRGGLSARPRLPGPTGQGVGPNKVQQTAVESGAGKRDELSDLGFSQFEGFAR